MDGMSFLALASAYERSDPKKEKENMKAILPKTCTNFFTKKCAIIAKSWEAFLK